jgi:hypothetical protein
MSYIDWLKNLKPGDKVAIETITGGYVIKKIARLTKTQIVLENCQKFYISSGLLVGGSALRRTSIMPVAAEIKEAIEKSTLIHKISKSHLHSISIESLTKILSIIESETRP